MKMRIAGIIIFFVAITIFFIAGYAIGETRGRGWRGAFIHDGCRVVCPHETLR